MDLFARTKAEFRHGQAEFLSRQLMTCSLYIDLASRAHEEGDTAFAGRNSATEVHPVKFTLLLLLPFKTSQIQVIFKGYPSRSNNPTILIPLPPV